MMMMMMMMMIVIRHVYVAVHFDSPVHCPLCAQIVAIARNSAANERRMNILKERVNVLGKRPLLHS